MDNQNPVTATESFNLMKDTLAQAKTDYTGLGLFWLVFSGINLLSAVLGYVGAFALNPWIHIADSIITPLLMIIAYWSIFRQERKMMNQYYLACFALWGIPAFAIPVFNFLIRLGIGLLVSDNLAAANALIRLSDYRFMVNILLLCFCYVICAFLLNRKWLVLFGLGILLSYWILDLCSNMGLLKISVRILSSTTATMAVSGFVYHFYMVVGYFVAGFLLQRQIQINRKD